MRRRKAILAGVAGALLACCGPQQEEEAAPLPAVTIEVRAGGTPLRLDLASLVERIEPVEFEVYNPDYKKALRYRGLPLKEVLQLGGIELEGKQGDLIFHCADGYAPSRSFETLAPLDLVLAFEEPGAKGWTPVPGREVDPGPFYVVSRRQGDYEYLPWPYQVVAIESIDFAARFGTLLPAGAEEGSAEMRGFRTFRQHCMSCHSINLVGGAVGPELNVPMNITEYRDEDFIRRFVRDPTSFRARSPMSPFPQLTDSELDDLIAYLRAMGAHKVELP